MLSSNTMRLTQQWCNAFRDGVGHTERQQQDADDGGSQPSHDEMEVNVSDSVSIHLQEKEREDTDKCVFTSLH